VEISDHRVRSPNHDLGYRLPFTFITVTATSYVCSQIAWDKRLLFCFSVIPGGYIHSVFEDTQ